jgi:multicomponent Na+:H+ antiporter subunit B
MNRGGRLVMFVVGALGVAALFGVAIVGLPDVGRAHSAYADAVDASSVPLRHISEDVGAVTFDFRGIDTLGEELILLSAIVAVGVQSRQRSDEEKNEEKDGETEGEGPTPAVPSEAVRFWGLLLVAPSLLVGLSLVAHGYVTPGGGFQGGVMVASAILLAYAAGNYDALSYAVPKPALEPAEAFGAAVYLGVGIAALVAAEAFLTNMLPLGTTGTITSGGMLALLNPGVAIEVASGVLIALVLFLEQALVMRQRGAS